MRKVSLAGIGFIKIKEYWERPLSALFADAALAAMKDAGTDKLDKLYVANMGSAVFQDQLNVGAIMADAISKPHLPAVRVEAGCASGGAAFHEAVREVASGYSDCVMVGGVEKMSDVLPESVTTLMAMAEEQEYTAYTGVTNAGLSAMLHRLYLDSYASPEEVGMMAVKSHDHAVNCGHAQYPFKMSIERAMASPMEADPIHSMECSGIGDGAAAIILTPLKGSGIEVAGSAVATDYCSLCHREDPLVFNAVKTASDKAYKMADIKPSDVDLAEVHDDFTINGVLSLESLQFCEKGKAASIVANGGIERNGVIPTNTFGGLKARGNPLGATGVYQIAEITLQLRGAAGEHQVKDAKIGLAQNMTGLASTCAVNILRRTDR
jgi:acetyl-CoA C-acetyltransferase